VKILQAATAWGDRSDPPQAPSRTPSAVALTRWSQVQQGDEPNGVTVASACEGARRDSAPTPDAVPLSSLRRHERRELVPAEEQMAAVSCSSTQSGGARSEKLPASGAGGRGVDVATLLRKGCERVWVDAPSRGSVQAVIVDLGRWWPGCMAELSVRGGSLRVTLRGGDALRSGELDDALEGLRADLTELCGRPVLTQVDVGHRGER
jgi:hypothetical protein